MDVRLKEIVRIFTDALKEKCMDKQTSVNGNIFLPPKYTVRGDGEGGNPIHNGTEITIIINNGSEEFWIHFGHSSNYFLRDVRCRTTRYVRETDMLKCSQFREVFLNMIDDIMPEYSEEISAILSV